MKKRFAVLFAAIILLCGCSKSAPTVQQTTEEEYPQELPTTEYSEPEYTTPSEAASATSHSGMNHWWFIPRTTTDTTPEVPTEIYEEPAVTEPQQTSEAGGVDLVMNEWSVNNMYFSLNGNWCGISDIKAEYTEFTPPVDLKKYEIFDHCPGYIFFRYCPEREDCSAMCWDMQADTVREIYTGEEKPVAASENYLALYKDHVISVKRLSDEKTIVTIPEEKGRTVYSTSMCIVYDKLYFDGQMTLHSWGEEFQAVFTCDLLTKEIELYKIGARVPHHGVGNVSMKMYSGDNDLACDLRGNCYMNSDAYSYYFIKEIDVPDYRVKISFIDKDSIAHILGTTVHGYGHEQTVIQRDGLFITTLSSFKSMTHKYIIGRYDFDTGELTAALYDPPFPADNMEMFFENDRIVIVNYDSSKDMKYKCVVITPTK